MLSRDSFASTNNYLILKLNQFIADERSKGFFLVDSPVSLFCVLTSYVYFVTKLGPWLMRNRAAFNLKTTMIIYNAFQIVANAFIFIEVTTNIYGAHLEPKNANIILIYHTVNYYVAVEC